MTRDTVALTTKQPAYSRTDFFRQVLAYAPSKIIPAGVGFVILALLTRHLRPEEAGAIALTLASATLLGAVSGTWINHALLRYYPESELRGDGGKLLATVTSLTLALAMLLLLTGAIVSVVFGGIHIMGFAPGAVLVLAGLTAAFNGSQAILMARGQAARYSVFESFKAIGILGGVTVVIFLMPSADGVIFAYAAGTLVAGLLSFALGGRVRPCYGFDQRTVRTLAAYGVPLMLWFIGDQVLSLSDRYVLQALMGEGVVGIYHASYQLLPSMLLLLFTPFLVASHNHLIRAAASSAHDEVEREMTTLTRFYLLIGFPAALVVSAIAEPASRLLLGERFQEGWIIVPWIAFGVFGWNLAMYGQKRYELVNRTRFMLALLGICAVFNLVLTYLLVPRYGYVSAAAVTFASYWLYPALVYWSPGSSLNWRIPWKTFITCAAATLVSWAMTMPFVAYAQRFGDLVAIAIIGSVAIVAYVATVLALGEGRDELKAIRGFLSRALVGGAPVK